MEHELSQFLIEDRLQDYEYTPIDGSTPTQVSGAIIHRVSQEYPQDGIGTRVQLNARLAVMTLDMEYPAAIGDTFTDSDGYVWSVMSIPQPPSMGLWWIDVEFVALTHKAHTDRIR